MNRWSKGLMVTTLLAAGFGATLTWNSCSDMTIKSVPGFSPEVADIIIKKCTPCHAGGKSEKGFGYVDKPALLIANGYITPGDSAGSLLYKKVSATPPYGDRMPKGGPYLNDAQLAIVANWIDTMEDPSGTKYSVAISASTGITTSPNGTASVGKNQKLAITVTPPSGVNVAQAVGGTCAAGTWSGSVYTTGKVTEDCSVVFTKDNEAVVTGSGTGVTLVSSNITVEKGNTAEFDVTVRAGDSINFNLTSISGTCPKGAWSNTSSNHGTYTTGTITTACTVIFSTANPCPTVITGVFAAAVDTVMANHGCTGCHDPDVYADIADFTGGAAPLRGLDGTRYSSRKLVKVTSSSAGLPLESMLYINTTSDKFVSSAQMPLGNPHLSSTEQSTICNWIFQGAQ